MKVRDIMSQPVVTCRQTDTLSRAAQLMWEHDCGAIPVVSEDGQVTGIITDRDICMAAWTQGRTLDAIPVSVAMARQVFSCHPEDSVETAERLMADKQIRRLPIIDSEGRPVGVLSTNDIARSAAARPGDGIYQEVVQTMAAICQPRSPMGQDARRAPAEAAA